MINAYETLNACKRRSDFFPCFDLKGSLKTADFCIPLSLDHIQQYRHEFRNGDIKVVTKTSKTCSDNIKSNFIQEIEWVKPEGVNVAWDSQW
jgi:hypothetical protein